MHNRHAPPRMRSILFGAVALLLVVGAALAGFSYWQSASEKQVPMAELESLGPIPAWLAASDTKVIQDYAWALNHHEELQYIPCYCGCDTLGHKNNSTCYFKRDAAGKVTEYEGHALTGMVCLDITRAVRRGLDQGKSLNEIRQDIDQRYQEQGLKPTDTAMPPKGK